MPFSSFCQGAVQLKCFSSPFVKESLHSLGKGPVGINPFPVFLIPLGHHRVCFNTPSAAFINDLPGVIKDGFDVVVIAGLCFSIVSSLLCCVDLLFPALPYLPAQSLGCLETAKVDLVPSIFQSIQGPDVLWGHIVMPFQGVVPIHCDLFSFLQSQGWAFFLNPFF